MKRRDSRSVKILVAADPAWTDQEMIRECLQRVAAGVVYIPGPKRGPASVIEPVARGLGFPTVRVVDVPRFLELYRETLKQMCVFSDDIGGNAQIQEWVGLVMQAGKPVSVVEHFPWEIEEGEAQNG